MCAIKKERGGSWILPQRRIREKQKRTEFRPFFRAFLKGIIEVLPRPYSCFLLNSGMLTAKQMTLRAAVIITDIT